MVVIYGMIVTSDAVIVHGRDYGDTSRIVVAYTQEHGMLSLMAKGVRKPGNGMSGALESFQESRLTIYLKAGRELQVVSRAEVLRPRVGIDRQYDHMVAGMSVCDVVLRTQVVGVANAEVWEVVRDGLRRIDRGEQPWQDSVAVRLALARVMGFGLPLSGEVGGSVVMVRIADGVVLSNGIAGADVVRMSGSAWRYLEAANGGAAVEGNGDVLAVDRGEVEGFLRLYIGHHIERSVGLGVAELFARM